MLSKGHNAWSHFQLKPLLFLSSSNLSSRSSELMFFRFLSRQQTVIWQLPGGIIGSFSHFFSSLGNQIRMWNIFLLNCMEIQASLRSRNISLCHFWKWKVLSWPLPCKLPNLIYCFDCFWRLFSPVFCISDRKKEINCGSGFKPYPAMNIPRDKLLALVLNLPDTSASAYGHRSPLFRALGTSEPCSEHTREPKMRDMRTSNLGTGYNLALRILHSFWLQVVLQSAR